MRGDTIFWLQTVAITLQTVINLYLIYMVNRRSK